MPVKEVGTVTNGLVHMLQTAGAFRREFDFHRERAFVSGLPQDIKDAAEIHIAFAGSREVPDILGTGFVLDVQIGNLLNTFFQVRHRIHVPIENDIGRIIIDFDAVASHSGHDVQQRSACAVSVQGGRESRFCRQSRAMP